MRELTYFRLRGCPYCVKADRLIRSLIEENPEYGKIVIHEIYEEDEKALADSYDYYYVPCIWCGDKKLHEGDPSKEKIKAALDFALAE